MKKCMICGIVLLLCAAFLCGCTIVLPEPPLPETGIWYCEELDMYLDVETSTGYFCDIRGKYKPLFYDVGFDQRYHIHYCESPESVGYPALVKQVNMRTRYTDGILWLTDEATNIKYKFVEVDRELYPGGK